MLEQKELYVYIKNMYEKETNLLKQEINRKKLFYKSKEK